MIKMQRMGLIAEVEETDRERMERNGWVEIKAKAEDEPKPKRRARAKAEQD